MKLLKEYIQAIIADAIARPQAQPKLTGLAAYAAKERGDKPKMFRPQFKLSEFKALPNLYKKIAYADQNLEYLGEGTSRVVFRLSGGKVLKLARNSHKGIAQNKAELDLFTNPRCKNVITKIFDYDPSYHWLIAEVARPLSQEGFQQATGIPWDDFTEALWVGRPPAHDGRTWDEEQTLLMTGAVFLIKRLGLEIGDVNVNEHWGLTGDGRVVLLDYGYTNEVRQTHYMNTEHRPWEDEEDELEEPSPPKQEKDDEDEPVSKTQPTKFAATGMAPQLKRAK